MISKLHLSHLALILASILFGFNYFIIKSLMPNAFDPSQIIFLRLIGTAILFWIIGLLFYREKVEKKDLFRLAMCSILGVTVNQILFVEGINLTTPVNASFIQLSQPIIVLVFAALIIDEKITTAKVAGVVMGIAGTVMLIIYDKHLTMNSSTFKGNLFIVLNLTFYSLYMVFIKPIINKYHSITIMKWVFLFGLIFALPYASGSLMHIDVKWNAASTDMKLSLLYVIFITTFLCYYLITVALKYIEAGIVSYYGYIQPVIVTIIAVWMGTERIDLLKIVSISFIVFGVYLVSRKVH